MLKTKKNLILIITLFTILISTQNAFAKGTFAIIEVGNPFKDLETHWSKTYVIDLYKRRIIAGYSDNNFKPDQPITRAELTKLALEAFVFEEDVMLASDDPPFKDIKSKDWFFDYIMMAKDLGIISGYSDNTFKPNQSINRSETIKILISAAGFEIDKGGRTIFPDVSQKDWYAPYVSFAYSKDIVGGYEETSGSINFKPTKAITRAEASKMVSKILKISRE